MLFSRQPLGVELWACEEIPWYMPRHVPNHLSSTCNMSWNLSFSLLEPLWHWSSNKLIKLLAWWSLTQALSYAMFGFYGTCALLDCEVVLTLCMCFSHTLFFSVTQCDYFIALSLWLVVSFAFPLVLHYWCIARGASAWNFWSPFVDTHDKPPYQVPSTACWSWKISLTC